jgi:hypothetical protein
MVDKYYVLRKYRLSGKVIFDEDGIVLRFSSERSLVRLRN